MIIFFIFLFFFIGGLLAYNSMVNRKNKVDYAFSSLDAILKKRYDLLPNLVNSVKGYMKHEKNVLENITNLRGEIAKKELPVTRRFQDENMLAVLLQTLAVKVENYPELKASQNFLDLQEALNEVEEQISAARRAYNATVFEYNNGIEMFPLMIVSGLMGYQKKDFFAATEDERKTPSNILK